MRTLVVFLLLLGFPLAEGTKSPSTEAEFWTQSGIDTNYVQRFVKNELCAKSDAWREACLRAIRRGVKALKESPTNAVLKAEWERQQASIGSSPIDFAAWIQRIDAAETVYPKAMVWGLVVNTVMSTFDAHSKIQPSGLFNILLGSGAHDEQGLGIQFEVDQEGVMIRRVFNPSPAKQAGIQVNDRLIAINGEKVGTGIEALSRLKKIPAVLKAEVKLDVLRAGVVLQKNLRVARVLNSDVSGRILSVLKNKYAVISVYTFASGVCQGVQDEVRRALKQKVSGIILDLRFNPGGRNSEAICMAKIFAGDKRIMFHNFLSESLVPQELNLHPVVFSDTEPEETLLLPDLQTLDTPLVVLINASTASVSEMIAAAFQDLERAWVVGGTSFGKGTFQLNVATPFNPSLRMTHTIFEVLRLNGAPIQINGVEPNFHAPFESADEGRPKTFLRERDLFPFAVEPSRSDKWKETREAKRDAIAGCLGQQGWASRFAKEMVKRDGFEDFQQAFAMGVLRCDSPVAVGN